MDSLLRRNLLLVLLVAFLGIIHAAKKEGGPVSCGSVVKLKHKDTNQNLHSHNIAWGSGSGQQSVTTNKVANDRSSLWLIKEAYGDVVCNIGTPIKCGDVIRLEHVDTGKNLHSHLFRAPLSGQQEVSGFGDGGNGDTGDNWQVLCDSGSDKYWTRYSTVSFMHVDTKKYLSTAQSHKFNQQNCGGNCPIMDQTEVAAANRRDSSSKWFSDQGVYFPPKDSKQDAENDDEL